MHASQFTRCKQPRSTPKSRILTSVIFLWGLFKHLPASRRVSECSLQATSLWPVVCGGGQNTILQHETLRRHSTRCYCMDAIWAAVSEDLIRLSLKCCGISNELDGSEDEFFHSALTRALSVAAPSDSESDYMLDHETNVYYSEDDNLN